LPVVAARPQRLKEAQDRRQMLEQKEVGSGKMLGGVFQAAMSI
jgi:hypothetical protein